MGWFFEMLGSTTPAGELNVANHHIKLVVGLGLVARALFIWLVFCFQKWVEP